MANKNITKVNFPTLKEESIEGFEKYLKELGNRANMEVKTWDKVPGRHAIAAYGRNIALVTLNKNGKFSVHTNEKMLSGKLQGSKIIKNGSLSVYITKCDNIPAAIELLKSLVDVRYTYAKDKTSTTADVSKIRLVSTKSESKSKNSKPTTPKKKRPAKTFTQIKPEPETDSKPETANA